MVETVFSKVDYTLGALMDAIEMGTIGLPDIQRPFVWKNAKVRDLFDSMYRGYPVGYLLFWENGDAGEPGGKIIGNQPKQKAAQQLIVDGQQRLTSLYAVIKGVPVVRENYKTETIEIAFNPLTEKIAVADAATRQDKSFIPNVSVLWGSKTNIFELVESYISNLSKSQDISSEERRRIGNAIVKMQSLLGFPFTALTLSANIDEEQVSDVFVRINSAGKSLNQADFILTLMSVFWDEGRSQLEAFCRDARQPTTGASSSFNHLIKPFPDQLLRVCVGVGFRRAKLQSVYSILRGKDMDTGEFNSTLREQQFNSLKKAQSLALSLTNWHEFLKAVQMAGFRSRAMISSEANLLFAYVMFLIGQSEFKVDPQRLRRVTAQWFFMSALTSRYANSAESTMEFDLARLREVKDADRFVEVLRDVCDSVLTSDYWTIGLPNQLATSAAISPALFAYYASLNLLEAKALFSPLRVADLLDPSISAPRTSLERHHLFPKAYLQKLGISDPRDINQTANFTLIEWGTNGNISDEAPSNYVPLLSEPFPPTEMERMCHWHALPDGWENMDYHAFLRQRREAMARLIREAYLKLAEHPQHSSESIVVPVTQLVAGGENGVVEFKSTLRTNLHTGQQDTRMELAVLKTIAAFVNSGGGNLIIGAADDGAGLGVEADKFPNEDKMTLHLGNLIRDRIGPQHAMYIHPRFDDLQDARVLAVECLKGRSPVFVKDQGAERFYVRNGAATLELSPSQTQDYIKSRFGG